MVALSSTADDPLARIVTSIVAAWRPVLRGALLVAAVLLPFVTVFWQPLAHALVSEAPRVNVRSTGYVIYYIAPMTFIAPLWLRTRIDQVGGFTRRRAFLDLLAFGLSTTRSVPLLILFPLSGHSLFLSYTLATTPDRSYRWLAGLLLAETTYLKLVLWHDATSWSVGLAVGLALALGFLRSDRRDSSVAVGRPLPS